MNLHTVPTIGLAWDRTGDRGYWVSTVAAPFPPLAYSSQMADGLCISLICSYTNCASLRREFSWLCCKGDMILCGGFVSGKGPSPTLLFNVNIICLMINFLYYMIDHEVLDVFGSIDALETEVAM